LKDGALDRTAFIQRRQALFRRLEVQLQGAARLGTGLQGNESLKKVLGLSTKRYLHKGEIAGYAKRMREIAQMSKWLGKGTYVGLALDVGGGRGWRSGRHVWRGVRRSVEGRSMWRRGGWQVESQELPFSEESVQEPLVGHAQCS